MIEWQATLPRRLLQKNLAISLMIAIALHLLVVWIFHLDVVNPEKMNFIESRRLVQVQLQPYAEIIRLDDSGGGGQGGGEGGGSLTSPLPKEIPGTPVPVPDAVAHTDTLAITPAVSPALDSANAGGTGLPGSSWGSGGTGWGIGRGSGVGLSRTTIIAMPRPILISIPEYPQSARKAEAEGFVELKIKIDETGKVVHAIVLRNTTNNDACAQSAIAAALRSRYYPAQTAVGPDTIWVVRQFQFSLHN
ncbi:MAG: TonB family protein [candidate division KSB1 bacterium]|nr:TonB family protein [candidate division KSB1 bacterium]MDZ7302876.1 TonB family protein [candidate division KSB1 bacterium]MDZ7310452.1 TonB family protein [candidate division KSB1 bacterium]